jgi:hypothetical protein
VQADVWQPGKMTISGSKFSSKVKIFVTETVNKYIFRKAPRHLCSAQPACIESARLYPYFELTTGDYPMLKKMLVLAACVFALAACEKKEAPVAEAPAVAPAAAEAPAAAPAAAEAPAAPAAPAK